MASSGIRRKVDDLGRVVIPATIRRTLGIREGDAVEVTVEGERVVLAKPRDACVFCGREDDDLPTYRSRRVCGECLAALDGLRHDGDTAVGGAPHRRPADQDVEPPRDRPIDGDALARRLAAADVPAAPAGGHRTPDRDDVDDRPPRPPHDPASTTAW